MKRLKQLALVFIGVLSLIILASCGGGSGVQASMSAPENKITRTTVDLDIQFKNVDNLKNSTVTKTYVKEYLVGDNGPEYQDVYVDVTFSNNVYTSASVTVKSLTKDTKYLFILCVTYNGAEEQLCSCEVKTKATGDDSTDSNKINSLDDFIKMENDPSAYYTLESDITIESGSTFKIFESSTFKGTLDGNGHKISGMKYTSNAQYTGLIGQTDGATIKNLTIENIELTNASSVRSSEYIGGLVAKASNTKFNDITVNNVKYSLSCTSSSNFYAGAVVGLATNCKFDNVKANAVAYDSTNLLSNVHLGLFAGAISGSDNILVKNCHAQGEMTLNINESTSTSNANIRIGGFVGYFEAAGEITECSAKANIYVTKKNGTSSENHTLNIGGLVGVIGGTITKVNKSVALADIQVLSSSSAKYVSTFGLDADALTQYYTDIVNADDTITEANKATEIADRVKYDCWSYKLAKSANIGGVIGYVGRGSHKIDNNVYASISKGIVITAKANTDEAVVVNASLALGNIAGASTYITNNGFYTGASYLFGDKTDTTTAQITDVTFLSEACQALLTNVSE